MLTSKLFIQQIIQKMNQNAHLSEIKSKCGRNNWHLDISGKSRDKTLAASSSIYRSWLDCCPSSSHCHAFLGYLSPLWQIKSAYGHISPVYLWSSHGDFGKWEVLCIDNLRKFTDLSKLLLMLFSCLFFILFLFMHAAIGNKVLKNSQMMERHNP